MLSGFLDVLCRMEELDGCMAVRVASAFSGCVHVLMPTEVKVMRDDFSRIAPTML